jgi:hypothetical protein
MTERPRSNKRSRTSVSPAIPASSKTVTQRATQSIPTSDLVSFLRATDSESADESSRSSSLASLATICAVEELERAEQGKIARSCELTHSAGAVGPDLPYPFTTAESLPPSPPSERERSSSVSPVPPAEPDTKTKKSTERKGHEKLRHNAAERRRKQRFNAKLAELAELILTTPQGRISKFRILDQAVEWTKQAKSKIDALEAKNQLLHVQQLHLEMKLEQLQRQQEQQQQKSQQQMHKPEHIPESQPVRVYRTGDVLPYSAFDVPPPVPFVSPSPPVPSTIPSGPLQQQPEKEARPILPPLRSLQMPLPALNPPSSYYPGGGHFEDPTLYPRPSASLTTPYIHSPLSVTPPVLSPPSSSQSIGILPVSHSLLHQYSITPSVDFRPMQPPPLMLLPGMDPLSISPTSRSSSSSST